MHGRFQAICGAASLERTLIFHRASYFPLRFRDLATWGLRYRTGFVLTTFISRSFSRTLNHLPAAASVSPSRRSISAFVISLFAKRRSILCLTSGRFPVTDGPTTFSDRSSPDLLFSPSAPFSPSLPAPSSPPGGAVVTAGESLSPAACCLLVSDKGVTFNSLPTAGSGACRNAWGAGGGRIRWGRFAGGGR